MLISRLRFPDNRPVLTIDIGSTNLSLLSRPITNPRQNPHDPLEIRHSPIPKCTSYNDIFSNQDVTQLPTRSKYRLLINTQLQADHPLRLYITRPCNTLMTTYLDISDQVLQVLQSLIYRI